MKELLDALDRWRRDGTAYAVARLVGSEGSSPRELGAAMAVNEAGEVVGSVSGGCVEGAVVTEALDAIEHSACKLVSFGYSDDDAFAVGLSCGGIVHVFVDPATLVEGPSVAGVYDGLAAAIRAEEPVALATVIEGPSRGAKLLVRPGHGEHGVVGSLGDDDLDRVVARDSVGELAAAGTEVRHYGAHGEAREATVSVFVESFAAPPQMLVFGAVDFTSALVRLAKVLGYRVTVCDAREVFATQARFPQADDVIVEWPDRLMARMGDALTQRDALCVLTHDAKFDVPALVAAVQTKVGYIGAMGSRRTHADRLRRLREAGLSDEDLARIHAPVGLDVGARTPEETAVSICAEIIARRTGRTNPRPLSLTRGPIHERE